MVVRSKIRFKADDIWDAPDDGKRYEVIDGDLFVTSAPSWLHQRGSGMLYGYVWQHIYPRGLGEIVSALTGVVLDEENGVEPDLVYVSRERAGIITDRGIEGAPDLIVEILSPGTAGRDRGIKMRRYARAGVPHYWIGVPGDRALEVYRLGASGYELTGTDGPGTVFRPDLFPGLEIPVDNLWNQPGRPAG